RRGVEAGEARGKGEGGEANPRRPANSHSADVLVPGLLQAEYGYLREWERDGNFQNALGGELRFGVSRKIEFRWGGNFLVYDEFPGSGPHGFGDQLFTGEYHFKNQSSLFPALAASYTVKAPTANETVGLGTGRYDHLFTLLVSKQIHKFTVDTNLTYQILGQPGTSSYDQNGVVLLTVSHSLYGPVTIIAEVDGYSRLNPQTPAYALTLWALSYKVHRKVFLDVAVLPGITQGAPHKRVAFGVTYAIANLYPRRPVAGRP